MAKLLTIALAGNPNSGKTTVFNNLTGERLHVGNYPGVTVEKKEGRFTHNGTEIRVVDLPGTYSLTAYSVEERVARNFIIEEKPDVVVGIVDASNLERNLYLAVQIMELGAPLVLAFNMSDVAKARGLDFDLDRLSRLLGAPIVATVANQGIGMDDLADAVLAKAKEPGRHRPAEVLYGTEVEEELAKIEERIQDEPGASGYDKRWFALKLLENDADIRSKLTSEKAAAAVDKSAAHLERIFGDHPEIVIADRRYGFISGACQEAVRSTVEARHTMSDRIDLVLTNHAIGIPIFLALMYAVFQFTFTAAAPFVRGLEMGMGWLAESVSQLWPKATESALESLLVEGIVGGVGAVIVFLPNIVFLFLAIALLEDSGYMARAAFIMDRLMHRIGLHGKSFIPMLIGFGCSVPAILATRTLESRRDRLTTMLVVPLMSCGARLPIYALILPAFFPAGWRAPMLWSVYLIGIILAIAGAKLLRVSVLRGPSTPFVMELPLYRIPTLKGALIHTWERAWLYLKKAGTIILGISIVLWAMASYPKKRAFDEDYEALIGEARQALLTQVQGLNTELDLPKDSDLLTRAIQAEWGLADAEALHHPGEQALETARRDKDAAIGRLEQSPQGEVLARFLDMREAIRSIQADFRETVQEEELQRGAMTFFTLESRRDARLETLRATDPPAFDAARKYLTRIEAPYEKRIAQITARHRSEVLAYSLIGRVGMAIEPAIKPIGFDWRIGTALIGAVAAKEVFVAQMGVVYAVGDANHESEALRAKLRENYTPLVGVCIVLFCLIGTPCMATIAATRMESGAWRWALLQWAGLTGLAYIVALVVFQLGSVLGLGTG